MLMRLTTAVHNTEGHLHAFLPRIYAFTLKDDDTNLWHSFIFILHSFILQFLDCIAKRHQQISP